MRILGALALALAAARGLGRRGAAARDAILGTWRGTSICVKSPEFPPATTRSSCTRSGSRPKAATP